MCGSGEEDHHDKTGEKPIGAVHTASLSPADTIMIAGELVYPPGDLGTADLSGVDLVIVEEGYSRPVIGCRLGYTCLSSPRYLGDQ